MSAYKELAQHDGDANESNAEELDHDKCRAAVVPDLGRETPNIAKTYGRTCRGQHCSYLTAEVTSCFHAVIL